MFFRTVTSSAYPKTWSCIKYGAYLMKLTLAGTCLCCQLVFKSQSLHRRVTPTRFEYFCIFRCIESEDHISSTFCDLSAHAWLSNPPLCYRSSAVGRKFVFWTLALDYERDIKALRHLHSISLSSNSLGTCRLKLKLFAGVFPHRCISTSRLSNTYIVAWQTWRTQHVQKVVDRPYHTRKLPGCTSNRGEIGPNIQARIEPDLGSKFIEFLHY